MGIIESKNIWATSVRYLNDSKEYALAIELTDDILDYYKSNAHSPFEKALYGVMKDSLSNVKGTEIFVSSFSENADQLSQWRGYCPPANGYSIGFLSKNLTGSQREHVSYLAPCVYDENEQASLIERVIQDVLRFARTLDSELPENIDRVFREAFKLFEKLVPLVAPVVKHVTFAEELEWRLVTLVSDFDPSYSRFRPGRSMLLPFIEHNLTRIEERLFIDEVIIGPTVHPSLAYHSAEMLLEKHSVIFEKIRNSEIPYRDW